MPLNTEHYINLAGDTSWRDEEFKRQVKPGIYAGTWDSATLCAWQQREYGMGIQYAQLSVNVYGWCVINGSGLANFARMSPNFPDMFEAIKWGVAWANENAKKREFYAHRTLLVVKDPYKHYGNGL